MRGIEGVGGLAIGSTVGEPDVRFRLADEGMVAPLDSAARWTRHDIVEALKPDFGDYAFNAGFLQRWSGALGMGGNMRLIVSAGGSLLLAGGDKVDALATRPGELRPLVLRGADPAGKLRRTARRSTTARSLTCSSSGRRTGAGKLRRRSCDYGREDGRPKCAVIVPLYGRHDFMLNQLLAFSDDTDFFVSAAELVYVIDDHRLVSALAADWPTFEASFGVPFRTVWSGENRDAGATNLGVANSSVPSCSSSIRMSFLSRPAGSRECDQSSPPIRR